MSSSFDESVSSTRPFDDDNYLGYDPRLPSQRFDSFNASTNFTDNDSLKDGGDDNTSLPIFKDDDGMFSSHHQPIPDTPSPQAPIYGSGSGFSPFESELNGKHHLDVDDDVFGQSDGPVLPPPDQMQDEGFALREWRRVNAIQLAEKEKNEKELLNQIIDEADEYKIEFYRKRQLAMDSNKSLNREKEKLFVANRDKFHSEADKNYWKAIAELVPNEVPAIEKRRGKKDQDKKPSIVVVQGPKPGKPTDLARMRQILTKLKHNTPAHMKPPPPVADKDAKTGAAASKDAKTGAAAKDGKTGPATASSKAPAATTAAVPATA
ncbi:hypothetical protein C5167_047158 [Papaver somniferum]|uniref:Clathrin light chain n=1 Tax=Papaver somniferum TaxID=3469 RepID=A0A4Y7LIB3_PAPSO|nr:clathrin light chain 2-like [Papaver somniferum]RZC84370.1 hypothetical protein C5167_047158 [Papaver somniferum]